MNVLTKKDKYVRGCMCQLTRSLHNVCANTYNYIEIEKIPRHEWVGLGSFKSYRLRKGQGSLPKEREFVTRIRGARTQSNRSTSVLHSAILLSIK